MPVSKLKTIILLVLLAVDLFLCLLLLPRLRAASDEQAAVRRGLEARFAEAGISLSDAALADTAVRYPLLLTPDESEMLTAAAALLGQQVLAQSDSSQYLTTYSATGGVCRFYRSGSFSAELTGREAVDDVGEDARAVLEAMGFTGEIAAPSGSGAVQTVTATWAVLDTPVPSATLTLTYRRGALYEITGQFLTGCEAVQRLGDTPSIRAADALTAFLAARSQLGWVGGSVTDAHLCYLQAGTLEAGISLHPVWMLTTDTGEFQIDGISGTVAAIS